MARIADQLEFKINLGLGDEDPVLILRPPTDEEVQEFLSGRFVRVGKKIEDRSVSAKSELVEKLLVGCRKVEIAANDGTWIPLDPAIDGWKKKIPLNWKSSAGNYFEEREVFTVEDEKK